MENKIEKLRLPKANKLNLRIGIHEAKTTKYLYDVITNLPNHEYSTSKDFNGRIHSLNNIESPKLLHSLVILLDTEVIKSNVRYFTQSEFKFDNMTIINIVKETTEGVSIAFPAEMPNDITIKALLTDFNTGSLVPEIHEILLELADVYEGDNEYKDTEFVLPKEQYTKLINMIVDKGNDLILIMTTDGDVTTATLKKSSY